MTGNTDSYTFRLFKQQPTSPFMEAVGSIFDLSDSRHFYNYDETPAEADANSLRADWMQVGKDLRDAMHEYAPRQNA